MSRAKWLSHSGRAARLAAAIQRSLCRTGLPRELRSLAMTIQLLPTGVRSGGAEGDPAEVAEADRAARHVEHAVERLLGGEAQRLFDLDSRAEVAQRGVEL